MCLGSTISRSSLSLILLVVTCACTKSTTKLYIPEIEFDSLQDTTRSESSVWAYLNAHSLFHSRSRNDEWGYDENFTPVFLRGIPGNLSFGYDSHTRLDSTPKIGFTWIANDSTVAFAADSIRQFGVDNIRFTSRKARFDTLAARLSQLYHIPYQSGWSFKFSQHLDVVLMDDSSIYINVWSHHFAR